MVRQAHKQSLSCTQDKTSHRECVLARSIVHGRADSCQAGANLSNAGSFQLGRIGQRGPPGFLEDIAPAGQPVLQLGSRHCDVIITMHSPCQPLYKVHLHTYMLTLSF